MYQNIFTVEKQHNTVCLQTVFLLSHLLQALQTHTHTHIRLPSIDTEHTTVDSVVTGVKPIYLRKHLLVYLFQYIHCTLMVLVGSINQ